MTDIKILSANCQGLGNFEKRKDIFKYFRNMKASIVCLQDTHFVSSNEKIIENQWGFKAYFSSFASNSRGVAVLLNNNFEHKVMGTRKDDNGNLLALDIQLDSKRLTLVTIYGPNHDSPLFYENLKTVVEDIGNHDVIIVGDFNTVLDPELDYSNYVAVNNPRARHKILEIIDLLDLIDVYREFHPLTKRYTWRKRNPVKQSRLDFFLVTESLLSSITSADIEASYRSDHSPITLNFKLNDFQHKRGLWKFNNSLLYDTEYLNAVRNIISETKAQYVLLTYNRENLCNIPDSEIQFIVNDQLFLETLLLEIRAKTLSYSSFKKKEQDKLEKNLIAEIKILEEREKGRDLTQSYDKAHTPTEMSKGQSDNINNATKKFDYTAVADRLRTVSWSNYSHPTGVVYRF